MTGLLGEKTLRTRARTASNKSNSCFASVPDSETGTYMWEKVVFQ